MNALPRQTYKTPSDDIAEQAIADAFAAWAKASQLKIGADKIDQQKPRVDRLLYRGSVVAFFEVKYCRYQFGGLPAGWTMGRRKLMELRELYGIVRVPVLIVVRFGCGTFAYLDVTTDHVVLEHWGRVDRNDAADIEQGARFRWENFKKFVVPA